MQLSRLSLNLNVRSAIWPKSTHKHALKRLPWTRSISQCQVVQFMNTRLRETPTLQDRPKSRSSSAQVALRRAAQEARSTKHQLPTGTGRIKREVTAFCATDSFDIGKVATSLEKEGHNLDPFHTNLAPHVVHFQVPQAKTSDSLQADVFVLSSGTIVVWGDVDKSFIDRLVTTTLKRAANRPYLNRIEIEDLEYYEDETSDASHINGDTIVLGTHPPFPVAKSDAPPSAASLSLSAAREQDNLMRQHQTNLVLGKIAFSFGLARSTKVALLESQLERYFMSTADIPKALMTKTQLPYTRQFVIRKTGELLSMRSQLNLSSELTDALPDVFWDSRYELGLEKYFVQVSRALDIGVRIRALNEKMNYAQEIASVLQDRLSERHGHLLEWLIIALISVEVCFEIMRLFKEHYERRDPESLEALLRRYLEHAEKERNA